MNLSIRLKTWLYGVLVGQDAFGNRYYHARGVPQKRWVLYAGLEEASKVPADWHGWLHGTVDTSPSGTSLPAYSWQKGHLPNLTGTAHAYRPAGHVLSGRQRQQSGSDYEAWRPGTSHTQ